MSRHPVHAEMLTWGPGSRPLKADHFVTVLAVLYLQPPPPSLFQQQQRPRQLHPLPFWSARKWLQTHAEQLFQVRGTQVLNSRFNDSFFFPMLEYRLGSDQRGKSQTRKQKEKECKWRSLEETTNCNSRESGAPQVVGLSTAHPRHPRRHLLRPVWVGLVTLVFPSPLPTPFSLFNFSLLGLLDNTSHSTHRLVAFPALRLSITDASCRQSEP